VKGKAMPTKKELLEEIERLEGLCRLKEEAFQNVYDELHADGLCCPSCNKRFHDVDVETFPDDYTQCGYCGCISHRKCFGIFLSEPPEFIKIGNFLYKITFVEGAMVDRRGNELYGVHDFEKKEIRISTKHAFDRGLTLLHEIVHAVDHISGDTMPESEIGRMSTLLFGVLKDNRHATDYIFGYHNEQISEDKSRE
jgi:hypothetical protein